MCSVLQGGIHCSLTKSNLVRASNPFFPLQVFEQSLLLFFSVLLSRPPPPRDFRHRLRPQAGQGRGADLEDWAGIRAGAIGGNNIFFCILEGNRGFLILQVGDDDAYVNLPELRRLLYEENKISKVRTYEMWFPKQQTPPP